MRARAAPVGALLALACSGEPRWTAFVYPDRTDLSTVYYPGNYSTLEDCRTAVVTYMYARGIALGVGDYECGYKCRPFGTDSYICKRTEQ